MAGGGGGGGQGFRGVQRVQPRIPTLRASRIPNMAVRYAEGCYSIMESFTQKISQREIGSCLGLLLAILIYVHMLSIYIYI